MSRKIFLLFLLTSLAIFLFSPQNILADVQLSKGESNLLINSIQQELIDEWFDLTTSPSFSEPGKQAALFLIRNAIQQKELEYAFVELPREYLGKIVKIAASLAASPDAGTILDKIEEESVKKAISYATEWLAQNEIKVDSGTLTYSFTSYKGNPQNPSFYYNLVYHPLTEKAGEAIVEFYSPDKIEPGEPKKAAILGLGASLWEFDVWRTAGNEKLGPFIVRIKGKVVKTEAGGYIWSDTSVEVTFSESVPELPMEKPLSFWERNLLKPIEANIKDIEIIITKVTGKSINLVKIWNEIKSFLSKIKLAGPAAMTDGSKTEEAEIEEEIEGLEKTLVEEEQTVGQEIGQSDSELTPAEIEKQMVELSEKIKKLNEEIDKFNQVEKSEEEEQEEKLAQTLPKILISEVCAGLDKSENEFVELYNPNNFSVSLSDENFNFKLVNSSGNITKKKIIWNKNVIPAKGYFLFVGGELKIDGQTLSPDAVFGSQLTGTGGVIIADSQNNILDKVAWGKPDKPPPSVAVETQGITLEQGLQTGKSLERISQGDNLIDNDNNTQDFILNSNPSPNNSSGEKRVYSTPTTTSDSSSSSQNSSSGDTGSSNNGSTLTPQFFPVIINEIMYDLEGSDDGREWIEIFNAGQSSVDLTNWKFYENETNHKLELKQGSILLPPNGYAIIADDPDKFLSDWPSYSGILFDSTFSLSNTGENIAIKNDTLLIDQVAYDSSLGANGDGKSLQRISSDWIAALPTPGAENQSQSDSQSDTEPPNADNSSQETYQPSIGYNDPEEKWTDETLAYDGDTTTGARATETWSSDVYWWLELLPLLKKATESV